MENLVKIVFCGAPSSGKSASLQRLKITPHPEWHVSKTIEAASFIMENSELHPKSDPYSFQQVVSLLQLALENPVIESNAQKRHLLFL